MTLPVIPPLPPPPTPEPDGAIAICGECEDLRDLCREYAQMQREAGVFKGELRA